MVDAKKKWTVDDMLACESLDELEALYGDQSYYGETMLGYMEQYRTVFDRYIRPSDTVAEFGVHRCASSTHLLRRCKRLLSWEISRKREPEHQALARLTDRWALTYGDSRTAALDVVDALFIDSDHIGPQMRAELAHAASHVSRYILLHDTTTSWWIGHGNAEGIGPAVREFLDSTEEWIVVERLWPAPGMMVLGRR